MLAQFRPISLWNIEGKIYFSALAKRLTRLLLDNGFINTSVQNAGVLGLPGCWKHLSMIWSAIQGAKSGKHDLEVVWLDLSNRYGSVPHSAIECATRHYWLPDRLKNIVQEYYHEFNIRHLAASVFAGHGDGDSGIRISNNRSEVRPGQALMDGWHQNS